MLSVSSKHSVAVVPTLVIDFVERRWRPLIMESAVQVLVKTLLIEVLSYDVSRGVSRDKGGESAGHVLVKAL